MIMRLLALVTITFLFSACSTVVIEKRSPDGQYVASVVAHNTGATTRMMWLVTLRRTHFLSAEATVFSAEDLDQPSIRWDGSKKLVIDASVQRQNIGIQDSRWADVSIQYVIPAKVPTDEPSFP